MLFVRRQQLTILVLAVLFAMDFVFFSIVPSRQRFRQIEQKRSERLGLISQASVAKTKLPVLAGDIIRLKSIVGDYERRVPETVDLGGFLQEIANLMNSHNLKEQFIQPSGEIPVGELNCIPLNIKCEGDLNQIFAFYKSLQDLDRLIRIEQVSLTNDSDFKGKISMQTKAAIYYRPDGSRG